MNDTFISNLWDIDIDIPISNQSLYKVFSNVKVVHIRIEGTWDIARSDVNSTLYNVKFINSKPTFVPQKFEQV